MAQNPESASDRTASGSCCADDGCCSIDGHGLDEQRVAADVEKFAAVANQTRYEILRALDVSDDEICACELAPGLDVGQSTVSRALKQLNQAGLVSRRKEGRWRYYSTTDQATALLAAVDESYEENP